MINRHNNQLKFNLQRTKQSTFCCPPLVIPPQMNMSILEDVDSTCEGKENLSERLLTPDEQQQKTHASATFDFGGFCFVPLSGFVDALPTFLEQRFIAMLSAIANGGLVTSREDFEGDPFWARLSSFALCAACLPHCPNLGAGHSCHKDQKCKVGVWKHHIPLGPGQEFTTLDLSLTAEIIVATLEPDIVAVCVTRELGKAHLENGVAPASQEKVP